MKAILQLLFSVRVSLLLLVAPHASYSWTFTMNPSTVTISEGGSVPMQTTIALMTAPVPPAPGSATADAFSCLFGGTFSYPTSVYEKFSFFPDYFQYTNYMTSSCTLVQVAPVSCSSDVSSTNQIVLKIQMADLSQNFYTVGYSVVQDFIITVDCLTSTSTSTSTSTTPTTTATAQPFAQTSTGIAVITVSTLVGAALLGALIYLCYECCKPKPTHVAYVTEVLQKTPPPQQPPAQPVQREIEMVPTRSTDWTYYDVS